MRARRSRPGPPARACSHLRARHDSRRSPARPVRPRAWQAAPPRTAAGSRSAQAPRTPHHKVHGPPRSSEWWAPDPRGVRPGRSAPWTRRAPPCSPSRRARHRSPCPTRMRAAPCTSDRRGWLSSSCLLGMPWWGSPPRPHAQRQQLPRQRGRARRRAPHRAASPAIPTRACGDRSDAGAQRSTPRSSFTLGRCNPSSP